MPAARTLKGISDHTREAVAEAARAEGIGVSEWMERALAQAADAALNPKAQGVSREEVAEVVRQELREELAGVVELVRGVLREELVGSRVDGDTESPAERVRARMRRRRGL